MSNPRSTTSGPVVVGILYPAGWYGPAEGFAEEVRSLEALDPRIEVVVAAYDEPHDLRTARGGTDPDAHRDRAPEVSAEARAALARAEVVLAIDLPYDVGTMAPNLRWVQAVGAGTAQLQSAGLADAGIVLTSNGGSNSTGIAEFVTGRLLQVTKRFRELDVAQRDHRWEALFGEQLAGQTLGLIGYGAINQAVATRAAAFDMTVLATRNRAAEPEAPVERFFRPDELHDMLGRCDAVVAAAPETPATMGMVGAAELAAMRPGAFFANVGRGSLLDEAALIDALRDGRLAAAALDVASVEPLPADHPLWDAPNVYLSGHCSSSPGALFRNLHELFRQNLARLLDGRPLLNEVDLARGY
jgi:phosphoglycerate dehydrogenase-like enzyme